jgi:hypothetical protein
VVFSLMQLAAGKLADQTAKNDDISVELLNLISEKKQVKAAARRVFPCHTRVTHRSS